MEHLYVVSYDIRSAKRWRRVFRVMKGYGEWMQFSVFQCRLDRISILRMEAELAEAIDHAADHVLIIDIGPADKVALKVKSLGKTFAPVERSATIV